MKQQKCISLPSNITTTIVDWLKSFSYLIFSWMYVLTYFLDITNNSKKQTTFLATIMTTIFWHFLMSNKLFFSPQVKWSMIIGIKHGIYELPYDLPSDST